MLDVRIDIIKKPNLPKKYREFSSLYDKFVEYLEESELIERRNREIKKFSSYMEGGIVRQSVLLEEIRNSMLNLKRRYSSFSNEVTTLEKIMETYKKGKCELTKFFNINRLQIQKILEILGIANTGVSKKGNYTSSEIEEIIGVELRKQIVGFSKRIEFFVGTTLRKINSVLNNLKEKERSLKKEYEKKKSLCYTIEFIEKRKEALNVHMRQILDAYETMANRIEDEVINLSKEETLKSAIKN